VAGREAGRVGGGGPLPGCSLRHPRVPCNARVFLEAPTCSQAGRTRIARSRRATDNGRTMADSAVPFDRVVLHLKDSRRVVLEPDEIYYLEAAGDETIVRKRGRRTLLDVRSLAEVSEAIARFHFHRVHDKWAVNLRRVSEIRLQRDGRDWEVVMRPPVNRVIPVSRRRLRGLLARFGSSP